MPPLPYFTLLLVRTAAAGRVDARCWGHEFFAAAAMQPVLQRAGVVDTEQGARAARRAPGCRGGLSLRYAADGAADAARRPPPSRSTGRGLQSVCVTVGGRQILVANTHLESPMPSLSPPKYYTNVRGSNPAGSAAPAPPSPDCLTRPLRSSKPPAEQQTLSINANNRSARTR